MQHNFVNPHQSRAVSAKCSERNCLPTKGLCLNMVIK